MAETPEELAYDAALPALRSSADSAADALGIVALLVVLTGTLATLLPHHLTFRLSARVLLEDHVEVSEPTPVPQLQAFLARTIDRHHDENEVKLRRLNLAFQIACLALGVETLAWLTGV